MTEEKRDCPASHELQKLREEQKILTEDIDKRVANSEEILLKTHNRVNDIDAKMEEVDRFIDLKIEMDELLAILKSLKGFFIVLSWIGKAAKWIAALSLAGSLLVTALKRILE